MSPVLITFQHAVIEVKERSKNELQSTASFHLLNCCNQGLSSRNNTLTCFLRTQYL